MSKEYEIDYRRMEQVIPYIYEFQLYDEYDYRTGDDWETVKHEAVTNLLESANQLIELAMDWAQTSESDLPDKEQGLP